MKKVVIVIIGLLAIFSILRASAEETTSSLNIHPGTIEFADDDSDITIGFGLIESSGDKSRIWNIFPVKISLQNGKQKFYLAMNGLSFLTASGINFTKTMTISGTHEGDVISFGGEVTIKGKVLGNVWVFGTDVVLDAGAEVVGDVVSLGGNINADRKAIIKGNKYSLPELKIPLLGLLSSETGIQTIRFLLEIFQIILFLLLLFLILYFWEEQVKSQALTLFQHWKGTLIFLLASVIVLPFLFVFLVATLFGIIMLPVLLVFLIILAYFGFITFSIRLGKILLRGESNSLGHYYLCGLLGILMLKGLPILGLFLTMLKSSGFVVAGNFLTVVGSIAIFIAFLYGFGVSLVYLRARS